MNSIMTDFYPTFEMYQSLRNQLMDILTDEDLAYTPGGANPPLGTLCREMGEVEHAYIQSFKTFTIDFSYRTPEPGLETSVARLTAWYTALDQELKAVVENLTEEEVQGRLVNRGSFSLPPKIQLSVYQEALLIFYGKVLVYLRAMGKLVPQQWADWLG
jgi:uncharacterized damage-inducible protein DinB